jgi:hypothetical protein
VCDEDMAGKLKIIEISTGDVVTMPYKPVCVCMCMYVQWVICTCMYVHVMYVCMCIILTGDVVTMPYKPVCVCICMYMYAHVCCDHAV